VTALLATLVLAILMAPDKPQATVVAAAVAKVQAIIAQRCIGCHRGEATQEGFAVAPKERAAQTRPI